MFPLQQFQEYIKKNALFGPQDRVLLAVSGGKDSVLMAHLFKLAGFQFSIAHCNFNLRADESQRDEVFVKLLAANLAVPFYVAHFDTAVYAAKHRISIQMAARDLRYQWFEEVRTLHNYQYISVGHHQNDAIETLLLNLVRGTGISGLHGIRPKKDRIIRPILFLSRQEIDTIVDKTGIDFVTDSSNLNTKYARNKIRQEVIPRLEEINPHLSRTFEENIAHFSETEELLQVVVSKAREEIAEFKNGTIVFSIDGIEKLLPKKLLFFELMRPFSFGSAVTAEILSSLHQQTGASFYSRTHRATINRKELLITKNNVDERSSQVAIHPNDESVEIGPCKIGLSYAEYGVIKPSSHRAFVDVDLLIFPIIVRFREDGDRFIPFGMKHFKKLSDFLIDEKIPLPEKSKIPLLINGNGEIIWVAGLRQDNRYKVNATTKKVAIFELSNP